VRDELGDHLRETAFGGPHVYPGQLSGLTHRIQGADSIRPERERTLSDEALIPRPCGNGRLQRLQILSNTAGGVGKLNVGRRHLMDDVAKCLLVGQICHVLTVPEGGAARVVGLAEQKVLEMGFVGTYSNAEALDRVRRLLPKLEKLAAEGGPKPSPAPIRKRELAPVLTTVGRVLHDAHGPMQASEIHACVEALRGEQVPWSSVKDCLASNAKPGGRFVRVARGRYCLA
jgi:hypothetical protein